MDVRRCPLSRSGLGSDLLAACPGYAPVHVIMGHGPGEGLAGDTCAHIGMAATGRGFSASCHHPDAEWVVEAARRIATTIPARSRRRDRS